MPHYGLIRKTPDPREPRFVPSRRLLATLADWLDISAGMGPYLDQSALGSCGPNSAAECINFDQNVEGLPVYLVSRLFIYYTTRYLMGDVAHDTGVENKTMLTALSQYGFPSEALEPYVIADFAKMPTPADYAMALPNKLVDYAVVPQTLAGIQGVLVARRPFIFGFEVFQQIESAEAAATGLIRTPARGATPIGGHDMTAVGYNLSGHDLPGVLAANRWPAGTLKLRQHWTTAEGAPWGDCLVGDTQIALLDGTSRTIKSLAKDGKKVWVYSLDEKKRRIVPALAKPVFSGMRSDFVRVTLDNGESVVCTRDHKWMRRDGTYIKAIDLSPGDSLMPLHRKSDREYERFYAPDSHRWITTHWTVAHDQDLRDEMGHVNGCAGKCRLVVHHYDLNASNNDPRNLRVMFACRHREVHRTLTDSLNRSEQMRRRWRENREEMLPVSVKNFQGYNKRFRDGEVELTTAQLDARRRNASIATRAAAQTPITEAQREARRKNIEAALAARGLKKLNHKVVSVEPFDLLLPVFDLKVARGHCHNFALSAGVFVHNSGYGYISLTGYALNPALAGDFWVMTAIPAPVVPVPPTPPTPGAKAGKVMFQLTDAVPAGGIVSFDLVAPAK